MAEPFQVHLLRFKAEVTAPLLLPPAAGAESAAAAGAYHAPRPRRWY